MTMMRNLLLRLSRPCAALPVRIFACVAGALGLFLVGPVQGATCVARSGGETVPLVELYTSEGCSSCPPADRWLSAAFPADGPPATAVALAFHVDYWDRLGWKDRFAQPAFTQRQYDVMRTTGMGFVFTPQVLLQGRDYEGWRSGARAASIAANAAGPSRAEIVVEAEPAPRAIAVKASARVPAQKGAGRAALFVAYVDSGLVSRVKAGENAGKRFVHDHVVRALAGPFPANGEGEASIALEIARPAESGDAPRIVAFVQDTVSGSVLQTLALPCPPLQPKS